MLTAEQLNIRPQELAALVWVRDQLAAGEIEHHSKSANRSGDRVFNMGCDFRRDEGCGTVCCIGGWMATHMAGRGGSRVVDGYLYPTIGDRVGGLKFTRSAVLEALFFPRDGVMSDRLWASITTEEAVKTIDHFLATGAVEWQVSC